MTNANIKVYQDSNLEFGKIYCYRVRAYNTAGDSNYSEEFCVSTLATPVLSYPNNNATVNKNSVTLKWQSVEKAEAYALNVGKSCGGIEILDAETNGVTVNPEMKVSNLANGTYYWQAIAFNDTYSGLSDFSGCRSFEINVPPIDTVPPEVVNTNPANGESAALITDTITVTFSENIQPGTLSVLIVDENANSIPINKVTINGKILTISLKSALNYETEYAVGINAGAVKDLAGNSNSKYKWAFITKALEVLPSPALVSPVNDSIDISTTPTLKWSSVENAKGYTVQVSKDSNFGTINFNTVVNTTSVQIVPDLIKNTKYFWRVFTFNNQNKPGPWSEVWNFTTTSASSGSSGGGGINGAVCTQDSECSSGYCNDKKICSADKVQIISVTPLAGTTLQRGDKVPFEVKVNYKLESQPTGFISAILSLLNGKGIGIGNNVEVTQGTGTVVIKGVVDVEYLYNWVESNTVHLEIGLSYPVSEGEVKSRGLDSKYLADYPYYIDETPPINQPPTCSLSVNPISPKAGEEVKFLMNADDKDGSISSWELDVDSYGNPEFFGSGNPTGVSKTYKYQNPGTYTARLTVTDNDGEEGYCEKEIKALEPENQPPIISDIKFNNGSLNKFPAGTTKVLVSFQTNENATCRYSILPNTPYDSMIVFNEFSTFDKLYHTKNISELSDGATFNYYVKCKDEIGNVNDDYLISFSVAPPENQLSKADFTFSNVNPKTGEEVILDASKSKDFDGKIVEYCWDLDSDEKDDYRCTTVPKIFYYWNEAGIYSIKLKVKDSKGSENISPIKKEIIVKDSLRHSLKSWFKKSWIDFQKCYKLGKGQIDEEKLHKIKNGLNIENSSYSNDEYFAYYDDTELLKVLNKKVDHKNFPDLTYGIAISNKLGEMYKIDAILNQSAKTEFSKVISDSLLSATMLQVVGKLAETMTFGEMEKLGLIGLTISKAHDIEQFRGIGEAIAWTEKKVPTLKFWKKTEYYNSLRAYLLFRKSGMEHGKAWNQIIPNSEGKCKGYLNDPTKFSGPFPLYSCLYLFDKEQLSNLKEIYKILGDVYAPYSTNSGLDSNFKEQIIESLRKDFFDTIEAYKFELYKYPSLWSTPLEFTKIKSPGELRVYDSQENVTGLVNGEIKEDIPNSFYDAESKTVVIFDPSSDIDSYHYEVVGIDDPDEDTYSLEITSVKDGEVLAFTASDILTAQDVIHKYTVNWKELKDSGGEKGVTMEINADRDEYFEKKITTGSELKQDDFLLAMGYSTAQETPWQKISTGISQDTGNENGMSVVTASPPIIIKNQPGNYNYSPVNVILEKAKSSTAICYTNELTDGKIPKCGPSCSCNIGSLIDIATDTVEIPINSTSYFYAVSCYSDGSSSKHTGGKYTISISSGGGSSAGSSSGSAGSSGDSGGYFIPFTTTGKVDATPSGGGKTIKTNPDGTKTEINIPSNALLKKATILVEPKAKDTISPTIPSETIVGNYVYDLSAVAGTTPITNFQKPITLTFTYLDSQVVELNEQSLKIYYWDEDDSKWIALVNSKVNTETNTITATIDHFTLFAIMGGKIKGEEILADGVLAREEGTFKVYVIKIVGDKKIKRHIVSGRIFNAYGHLNWDKIQEVPKGTLDDYSLSAWVRVCTGPNGTAAATDKVYEINADMTKHWLNMTADQFYARGGSDEAIYNVNDGELGLYTQGPDVLYQQ